MTRVSTVADVSSFTTDAKFRTWGLAISTSLAACGLVQTADTGQIDWTTVTRATTGQTKQGYEIWRFDDDLQSTYPIFIRLDYGSGNFTGGAGPATWVQVGTGSSGAGVITGIQTVTQLSATGGATSSAGSTSTNQTMLFTHTDGYLLAYADSNQSGDGGTRSPMFFAIERTRDQVTGAPTTAGMYVWRAIYYSATSARGVGQAFSFTPPAAFAEAPTATMPPGDSVSYGGYLFPVYACIPRPLVCASLVGHTEAEIANYSTFTAKPMGVTGDTVTYISLANSGLSSLYGGDIVAGVVNRVVRTAFRWED